MFEEQPLTMDFKIGDISRLISIPIEGLGVYSYTASKLLNIEYIQTQKKKGVILTQEKANSMRDIGVIFNIKMLGKHKQVNIES